MNDNTIHECKELLAGLKSRPDRYKSLKKVYKVIRVPRLKRTYKKTSGKARDYLPKHLVDIFERKLKEKP